MKTKLIRMSRIGPKDKIRCIMLPDGPRYRDVELLQTGIMDRSQAYVRAKLIGAPRASCMETFWVNAQDCYRLPDSREG